jgi:hypothetical protein
MKISIINSFFNFYMGNGIHLKIQLWTCKKSIMKFWTTLSRNLILLALPNSSFTVDIYFTFSLDTAAYL